MATYGYGYDLNYTTGQYTMLGQRVSMTATVPSQGLSNHQTTYEYDSNYQLLKATYPNVAPFNGEVDSWTYDAIGNRLTNTVNGVTANYTYQKIGANPNNWQRLLSDGSNSYTYNANGSTVTRNGPGGNFTFAWAANYTWENKLYGISGATTASYIYDYQGRRASKTVGSLTTYLYDGLNLVREAGASSADYLFGPGIDEPLAMSRSGQVYYYETDALGSVNAVTNSSASVQNTYLYDAWGQVRSQTGSLANPFTYTSREVGEAGLNFYRARYYGSGVGRFLSEDATSATVVENFYGYVGGDPINWLDRDGLARIRPSPTRNPSPTPQPLPPITPVPRNRRDYMTGTITRARACYGKDWLLEIYQGPFPPQLGGAPGPYEQWYAAAKARCLSLAKPPMETYIGVPQVSGGMGVLACCQTCYPLGFADRDRDYPEPIAPVAR